MSSSSCYLGRKKTGKNAMKGKKTGLNHLAAVFSSISISQK